MNLPTREEIRAIYRGVRGLDLRPDLSGWNSDDPIFLQLIASLRPQVIVEVGAWKGRGTCHMAKTSKECGIVPVIFSIDFWQDPILQSNGPIPEHFSRSESAYLQFLFNIASEGHDDCVIPVRTWSGNGAGLLKKWGIVADLLYIDAGHTFEDASRDMEDYWSVLRPLGVMFGDDWGMKPVRDAVHAFCDRKMVTFHNPDPAHWVISPKP